MKSRQAPHQQLTDEEIKEIISDLVVEVHEIKEHFMEQIETIECYLYKLKRHFCPEKFQEMSVSMQDLNELLDQTYHNVGYLSKMKSSGEENGLAEAE